MKIRQTLLQEGYRPSIACSARDCGGESSLNLGALGAILVISREEPSSFYPLPFPRILRGKCTCTKPIWWSYFSWLTLRPPPPPPPLVLVCPVLRHLERHHRSFTMVVLDLYPRKYWWSLIQKYSTKSYRLAHREDHNALLKPSAAGWIPHPWLPGDLWAYALNFHWGKIGCNVVAHNCISTVIE